jgi:hypothetical protein
VASIVPHACLVNLVDGFRPFLGPSIGIQSICQSGVRTAEIVSAETEFSDEILRKASSFDVADETVHNRIVKTHVSSE